MIAAFWLYLAIHMAIGSMTADEAADECFTDACVGCIDDCLTTTADEGEEE